MQGPWRMSPGACFFSPQPFPGRPRDNRRRRPPIPLKSTIEISAARLRANFAAIQAAAGAAYDPLCVIKADAYGHGAALCAPVLVQAGAHWLGVGDVDEGVRVRQALAAAGLEDRHTRLLVMCGMEAADAPEMVAHDLTPVVWTPGHVHALEAAATTTDRRIAVHVELDTGMARQGVLPGEDLDALLAALREASHMRFEGLFTHLSSSEIAASPVTQAQAERFHAAIAHVFDTAMPEYLHLGNTSSIDEHSTLLRSAAMTLGSRLLVRPGLALYGYALPLQGARAHLAPRLQPVARWITQIVGLRTIAAGDTVGYGASFIAPQTMRLALLPVGYADGFRREASSGLGSGWVIVAGQRAPVVGRVSMNLTVVDVSAITPAPALGDEAVLLGEHVTAQDHARWCGTIPYEILCGMRGERRLV